MTAGLQIAAAVVVIAVGIALVRRRGHGHGHSHSHSHAHDHTHSHAPAESHAHARAGVATQPHEHAPDGHTHAHDGTHHHGHTHSHDGHAHDDGNTHDAHHHGHSHTSPETNPFSWKGLVALGLSGGLVPSPTVFLILVSGLVTGRVAFAVLLVVLFGVGMMVTISAVGWLTLKGMDLVRSGSGKARWLAGAARVPPRVAAWAVIVLGVTYLGLGVAALVA